MSWSLLQSVVSNAATATGTNAVVLSPTATIAATTPGSILVICSIEQSQNSTPNATLTSITGPSGAWATEGSWGDSFSSAPIWKSRGVFSFLKSPNTPYSGSVTVNYSFASSVTSTVNTAQFIILEFAGVTSSATFLDGGSNNLGSNSIPDPTSLFSTANNELVVVGYTGNSGTSGVPIGFTSGTAFPSLVFAGMAYKLNAPSTQTAAWSSGTQTRWGSGAHSLFGSSGTPINFGSIIGA